MGSSVLDRLADLDRTLFFWINHDQRNAVFDHLMPWITSEGHFKPFFVLLFVALIAFGKTRGRTAALLVIPLLVLSDQAASHFLKNVFDRPRPCNVLPEVHLLVGCSHSFSMPSSHATNASAAALHFMFFYPQLWSVLLLVVLAVGYSRVYVGVHYPSDVLVGWLVGLAAALIVQVAYRWLRNRRLKSRGRALSLDDPPTAPAKESSHPESLRSGS
jgi:undecaprenyl-diphosphatase